MAVVNSRVGQMTQLHWLQIESSDNFKNRIELSLTLFSKDLLKNSGSG
jgi:hypothetical protein